MKATTAILLISLSVAVARAFAVDSTTSTDAPDLSSVRSAIEARDYERSIAELEAMVDRGVQHADVYNLLGYSLRKSGDTKRALSFYRKALDFDPNHKGALEYLGELYVEIGDMANARANLARLGAICPQGCEELDDLQRAIAHATATAQGIVESAS